jgi:4-amino-4-deoxy-L-arabinose transferase-like glycosyltransferase
VFWVASLGLCLRTLNLLDDHFGRISPGRQILVFGELPFRDYLDPGYFLTEFSSAAVQWLFGQNLLGELLLNSLFIATGCLLVCVVTRRLTGNLAAGLVAGTLALLTLPRAYDYDKVLFYPLGILMAWRWLVQPRPRQLLALAATLACASLYRYDNGLFLGLATLAGVVAATWRRPRESLNRAAALVLATLAISAPALLFVQTHGGLGTALDQALTYGVRERDRTRIASAPRIHIGTRVFAVNPPPPSQNVVLVRWSPAVDSVDERQMIARRLGLSDERPFGTPERRTWQYVLADASRDRIRQLVNDPMVEDTDRIDRSNLVLVHPESRLIRLQRASVLRLRVAPGAWTVENAQAVFYYLLVLLPFAAALLLARRWPIEHDARRGAVAVVIALSVLLDVFILRDPMTARVGGMAGPLAMLAMWLVVHVQRAIRQHSSRTVRVGGRTLFACGAFVLLWSLAVTAEWPRQLGEPASAPFAIGSRLGQFALTPPAVDLLPSGRIAGLVGYVQRCTLPTDRVFASWFVPQLFYFAQRGFGGGISAMFGGHWSEPRFQERSIAAFEAQPTPLVLVRVAGYEQFHRDYPLLHAYFQRRYRVAGQAGFGDDEAGPDAYRVLVRVDRQVSSVDQATGLPCFGR